jgi:hypothetical protein
MSILEVFVAAFLLPPHTRNSEDVLQESVGTVPVPMDREINPH